MSYPAFHGVSQMAMYACPSLRNCANQGMYPPAVSNRPPKETASVPTSVGQLFGIITPCSWVMSVTSCASAWSKDSGAGQSTLSMRGSAPHSRSGTHSHSTSPLDRSIQIYVSKA